MDREFGNKILRNLMSVVAARLSLLAVAFLMTPYLLSRLGGREYGVWVLATALVGYLGLFDLGLGASFTKHVAEYHARGDRAGVAGVMSSGLVFYLAASAVVWPLGSLLVGPALELIDVPADLEGATRVVLRLSVATLLTGAIASVFQSVIHGLQRMEVGNALTVLQGFLYAAGSVLVLELGFGIEGLAWNQLLVQTLFIGASAWLAYRLYPGLRFDARAALSYYRPLARYGINLWLGQFAQLVHFQYDKILTSRFFDLAHVTSYDVGARLPAALRSFPALLLSVLTPATSELEVRAGKATTYELFTVAARYLAAISFPLFFGAMILGEVFLEAWVGAGYESSVVVLRILSVGFLFNVAAGPVSPLVQGLGRPEYQRNVEALTLALNVGLSLWLITRYGFYGAAVGTSAALSIASVYYLWSFHRLMERPLRPFLGVAFLKPALASLLASPIAILALALPLPHSRTSSVLRLLVGASLFGFSYAAILWKSRHLSESERARLLALLPFASRLRPTG